MNLAGENRRSKWVILQPAMFDYRTYHYFSGILYCSIFLGLPGIEPGGDIPSYTFFDSQLFIFRWLGNQKKDCQNLDSLGS